MDDQQFERMMRKIGDVKYLAEWIAIFCFFAMLGSCAGHH